MEKNKLQQQDEASKHNFCVPPPLCHSQSLPGPVLPGNKGKHWVGGGPTKNLSRRVARSSPARKQRKTLGWWLAKSTLPPLPAYQATGSTSSIHLNANQSRSSAIQLQTGVFSNLNQVAKLLPTHCFTPAGQPRGLVAF